MLRSPGRTRFTLIAGALALVAGLATSSTVSFAASSPRAIELERISSAIPDPASGGMGAAQVDPTTGRGFVVDTYLNKVETFAVTSTSMTPTGPLSIGTALPMAAALDDQNHVLYVVDRSTPNRVVAVNVDPASSMRDKVIGTYLTGGTDPLSIAVDSISHTVYVMNVTSNDVTVIDVPTGAVRSVATGKSPDDMAVDFDSHRAYVTSTEDESITTVFATGSSTSTPMNRPLSIALCKDTIFVSTDRPYGYHIEKYDVGMRLLATSPPLASAPNEMLPDCRRHALYTADAAAGVPGLQVFRTSDLKLEGGSNVDYYRTLTMDPSGNRLFASETGRTAGSAIVMFEPHFSPPAAVERVAGADRFEVSAAISRQNFLPNSAVAYVASGAGFADALSGSAVAGERRAPVLLVTKDGVPGAIADELARLKPRTIVILGGTAAVSPGVEESLKRYSGSVTRISGADRFVVSAAVSASVFKPKVPVAYLASGANFPDALSGSPAAGRAHAPVLLIEKDRIPDAVAAELARLDPGEIVVLGGPNAISEAVLDQLSTTKTVSRIEGADRFEVSAGISAQKFHDGAYMVYIASGQTFPDALSGAPVAIADGAPVLLVTRDSIPDPVAAELERLHPYRIVVLGGTAAVSDGVSEQLKSYLTD
ncbi:cell wall-binding repeat-containing protein [Herbiconiux sp. VKM Ac-1786]|uniref:cell wall-binding repeat-containing protein n=1 Tax=Herbiconiux sp. VKM Ac-1786 TaxID=2783824 RepID=UPI00188B1F39|nr:cell wall-binding repeat-containing protein [Herbiconiux sp. VKM Ac-1786]MBF4571134.1 cell wall-binding repeat-containing protein [Herbiconiux sp. VKM Ac-1786]